MAYKVVLYGSGKRCRLLCRILLQSDIEIIAIIDSDPNKWGCQVEGYRVESPESILNFQSEHLCITVADWNAVKEIRGMLSKKYQYKLENEIHYKKLILKAYKQRMMADQFDAEKTIYNNKENSILFDCYNGLILGGVEAWSMDLCQALIKDGYGNSYIISDTGNYKVPYKLEEHIIYVDINHEEPFSEVSIRNLMGAMIEKLPCKVITCTTNEVMLAAYLVKLRYPNQMQVISVIHNSSDRDYEECLDFRECPDLYVCVSRDIKADMGKRGISSKQLYSMTCPFACEEVLARSYSENSSLPVHIGYAGRMENFQKRMDLLLKLVKDLSEENVCFQMEIAGDGTARKEMEEFVLANHLMSKVHFLGKLERSEISSFWKRQDICVNLADFEGRSIGIIEAMGNGAVPVVTATSGVREDITDGVNGYIIPLEDVRTAVERIKYLSEHRHCLHEMGRLAHDAVYPKSQMRPHLEFWKKLLSGITMWSKL